MKLIFILVLLCFVLNCANSAKILLVFPIAAKSHYILGNAVTRSLVEAGHDATIIAPFVEKNKPTSGGKWTDILLDNLKSVNDRDKNNFFDMLNIPKVLMLAFMNSMGENTVTEVMEHPNVVKLLNSNEKFDLVIVEQFNNDAMKGFAHHFNAPLILFSTIGANGWVNSIVGNPSPPSYIPDIFLSYSSHMTFFERVDNCIFTLLQDLNRNLLFLPKQNKLLKKYFPNAPDLSALYYNASIILMNSHVSTNQPKPHVPSMIEIGGYHVSDVIKPLPKDIQDWINGAKHGVIYFSMGSNLRSSQLPIEKRNAILNTFSKLKQRVLWKWEEDDLPGKPDNVKLGKWLPQQDILAHPNVKLFITHGGLLSTTETIYFGKPILAIPVFGDQKVNAAQAKLNGFGLDLSYDNISEETLTDAINELLSNPKYSKNAQTRSKIMHDRPQKPKEALVYWVEYVLRHQGATHLQVSALSLAWYQYLILDVIAFVTLVTLGSLALLVLLIRKLCCKKVAKVNSKKIKKQ